MSRLVYLIIVCGLLLSTLTPVPVAAATFLVNSTADLPDADQGDGLCLASNGQCTLRAAIMQANFTTGLDTIILPAGVYQLTRPGDDDMAVLGDLDITDDLILQGAGRSVTIVDGNGAVTGDRVFQILATAKNVSLSGLTIRNGKKTNTFDQGGGLYWIGGGSHLILTDVVFENNAAYYGGGLYLDYSTLGDVVMIDRLVVRANTATAAAGGLGVNFGDFAGFDLRNSQVYGNTAFEGGGIYFQGTPTFGLSSVSIQTSEIYSNTASLSAGFENHSGNATVPVVLQASNLYQNHADVYGGGIGNYGTLAISTATLDTNSAVTRGGGIYNYEGGQIDMQQTTVSRNTAQTGGGIYSELFIHNNAVATLTNSTLSGNSASQDGAGIYADGGQINLLNATITGNQIVVPPGTTYTGLGGGVYIRPFDPLKLTPTATASNTLLAKNTHSYQPQPPVPDDCFGVLTSLGFNLIEQINNCNVTNTLGNITGQDPLLGPLQNNGGLTLTQELLAGSPAIDAGNNAACPATDQRGIARPYDGNGDGTSVCDIGAFEVAAHLSQSLQFGSISNKILTDSPFMITATASSGLPVDFSTHTPSVCNVTGGSLFAGVSSATVVLSTAGTCTLVAQQPGNPTFDPALAVAQTFSVTGQLFLPLILKI